MYSRRLYLVEDASVIGGNIAHVQEKTFLNYKSEY